MRPEEIHARIALSLLPELGPVRLGRALERWNAHAIAFELPVETLSRLGPGAKACESLRAARRDLDRRAANELCRARDLGLKPLFLGEADYPELLAQLPDAPLLVWIDGILPANALRIAVVGSRRASSYGLGRAEHLAQGLAAHGVEVVSGGARGIDTRAHHAALDAGGRTVAVLGSGFEDPYPRQNRQLFREIAANGAVVSEFPLDQPPLPGNFPRRNRIVSGLSTAVVVIEAGERSGSLLTAHHAADQGREVLAVPGPVTSDRSAGCHRLIQEGAKLVHSLEDIFEELPVSYRGALQLPSPGIDGRKGVLSSEGFPAPEADERLVLQLLDEARPHHVDQLAEAAPFGLGRLQLALLGLEVRGAIDSLPGGHYRRRDR